MPPPRWPLPFQGWARSRAFKPPRTLAFPEQRREVPSRSRCRFSWRSCWRSSACPRQARAPTRPTRSSWAATRRPRRPWPAPPRRAPPVARMPARSPPRSGSCASCGGRASRGRSYACAVSRMSAGRCRTSSPTRPKPAHQRRSCPTTRATPSCRGAGRPSNGTSRAASAWTLPELGEI